MFYLFMINFFLGKYLYFYDVVDFVKVEVQKIKFMILKVDILIGVGYYGYGNDKKLVYVVFDFDIIVGGYIYMFLYDMMGKVILNVFDFM